MFVDEAGLYLLPMLVRTYAPVGQTPVLRVPLRHDHLSVIGGITPDGRICMQMQESAYRAEDVVAFLRVLVRKIRGKLLVIWDGSPIHRAKAIKAWSSCRGSQAAASGAAAWLCARVASESRRLERGSNGGSCKTCAVMACLIYAVPGFGPKNASAIERRVFKPAFFTLWARFSKLSGAQ